MRTLMALCVAGAVAMASLAPAAGQDSRCDHPLYVFSWNSLAPAGYDYNSGAACRAVTPDGTHVLADGPYDFRLINPNADEITLRYGADDVPRRPKAIRARLNGLGFDNRKIFLNRENISTTGTTWAYDSGTYSIDPQAQGCLEVEAWYSVKKKVKRDGAFVRNGKGRIVKRWVKLFSVSTTYHTIDTLSC